MLQQVWNMMSMAEYDNCYKELISPSCTSSFSVFVQGTRFAILMKNVFGEIQKALMCSEEENLNSKL